MTALDMINTDSDEDSSTCVYHSTLIHDYIIVDNCWVKVWPLWYLSYNSLWHQSLLNSSQTSLAGSDQDIQSYQQSFQYQGYNLCLGGLLQPTESMYTLASKCLIIVQQHIKKLNSIFNRSNSCLIRILKKTHQISQFCVHKHTER